MNKVYIVNAKRSPIGKFMGSLSSLSPSELAGQVIRSIIEESRINPRNIDEVILGNVLSAGHGQNIARQASIFADIPQEVTAYTVNMVCGSGMKSIINAFNSIRCNEANLIVAGGVEVMSQAGFVVDYKSRLGNKMGNLEIKDTILLDGLTDKFNNYHMGITAENISDKYNIFRQNQDMFAIKSQQKAIKADDEGKFKDEIVPIKISKKNEIIEVFKDEYINRNTTLEKLSKLKTVFKKDGTVTAGNSSGINDGASFMILASEYAVEKYNLTPMAEIVSFGQGGVDPSIMGIGPVPAIKNSLDKINLKLEDIDILELNEAFSSQSLGVIEELKRIYKLSDKWFEEKVNINGGAISLGHPIGASGARIVTTLIYEMNRRKYNYGLASLCIGGGMGISMVLKKV